MGWGVLTTIAPSFFTIKRLKPLDSKAFDGVVTPSERNYQGWTVKEAWFILTDLGSLPAAITADKQRMGIEESYLDYKTGGYEIEGIGLKREWLIKIILLMAIAYSSAIFQGTEMSEKAGTKVYISF